VVRVEWQIISRGLGEVTIDEFDVVWRMLEMSTPTEAEIVALGEAGPLLRFASEHVTELDPQLSLAIAEASDAKQSERWTPEISQRFWQAFGRLCDLIKPVTMESLAATHRNIDPSKWSRLWRRGQK
jgi:hypothetical protein